MTGAAHADLTRLPRDLEAEIAAWNARQQAAIRANRDRARREAEIDHMAWMRGEWDE